MRLPSIAKASKALCDALTACRKPDIHPDLIVTCAAAGARPVVTVREHP